MLYTLHYKLHIIYLLADKYMKQMYELEQIEGS